MNNNKSTGLVRALLFGPNYTNTSYEVEYTESMIQELKTYIENNFPSCKSIRVLTDHSMIKPTRKNLLDSLKWLYKDIQDGQHVYFHFIGHGGHIFTSTNDLVVDIEKCVYTANGQILEKVTEEEITEILCENLPENSICFTVFDCCHPGIVIPLQYLYITPSTDTIIMKYFNENMKTNGQVLVLSCFQDLESLQHDVKQEDQQDFLGVLSIGLLDIWNAYGNSLKIRDLLWMLQHFLQYNNFMQIPQLSCGKPIDIHSEFNLNK
jgi:hypothetical protein